MTFPEVQFVAAPEDGAEVLFDFNDNFGLAPAQIIAGSFSLGTPTVEGDPDGLGVKYGPREVSFSLLVFGSRYAAMETQAVLARTFMLRRRGWLRVKLDEFMSPVWLRTYTPTPAELDFSLIQPDSTEDAWQIEVTVAAEPFIRGERVTLWTGQIQDNPASTGNPTQALMPEVVGDAPAPLRIEATFGAPRDQHDILWATSAVPSDYEPIVWQIGTGDGWTVSSDTTAPVTNSAYSGGSYRSVTFASTALPVVRLSGYPPSIQPGRYKVFLRAARNSSSGVFSMRFGHTRDGGTLYGTAPAVRLDYGVGQATMLDLGEFEFPLPRTDADVPTVADEPFVALAVERLSGTANLILDAFVLVPVDLSSVTSLEPWEKSDMLVSSFSTHGPRTAPGETQVWDGDAEVTFCRLNGVTDGYVSAVNRGRFPTARPGVSNLLTLFHQTRPVTTVTPSSPAELSADSAIFVTYQPRHLWLGGG